jgi:hypothetical protein
MADYYNPIGDPSFGRIRTKLNQMRLGGQTVTPAMLTSLYTAELNANADEATKRRALELEKARADAAIAENKRQFDINAGLKEDELKSGEMAGIGSMVSQAGTGAMFYDAATGGKLSKGLGGMWDKVMGNQPTTADIIKGYETQGIKEGTGKVLGGGTGLENTPEGMYSNGNIIRTSADVPMGETSTTGIPSTVGDITTTETVAAPTAETGTSIASGALVPSSEIAADFTGAVAGGDVAGASGGAAGFGSYIPVVGAGYLGGKLGGAGGRWVGEQLGIGGERERSIGGGIAGGAASGAAVGAWGGPVGAGAGAIIGGIVGGISQLFDGGCTLFSYLYGESSPQVRYAKVFCYRFLDEKTLLGYYQTANFVKKLSIKYGLKGYIKGPAESFYRYMKWKLGKDKKGETTWKDKVFSCCALKLFRVVNNFTTDQFIPIKTCIPIIRERDAEKGVL